MREELRSDFLQFGAVLEESIKRNIEAVSSEFANRLGELWDARQAMISVIASIHSRPDKAVPIDEVKQKLWRASIHTAIIQGLSIVESAIISGSYAQASALVRQEMEAVEALRGIRSGKQEANKTPRLVALRHLGRAYSQLTSLSHLSGPTLLQEVTDIIGSGIDHKLNANFEEFLFCLHLTALVGVALDMTELRPVLVTDALTLQEGAWLTAVCGLLSHRGFLKVS